MLKAGSIKKWFDEFGVEELLTSTPSKSFGMNWNADYEPGLYHPTPEATSRAFMWPDGTKPCSQVPKSGGKSPQKSGCSRRSLAMVLE